MSEAIEQESTELVTLPAKESALTVYSSVGGLDPLIEQIRAKVAGTVYDMTTAKGRDECRSDAAKIARSKTAIEKLGKALSAEYKEIPRKIDAERKRAFDELEALQKQVRQPLTEWEEAEERRKATHEMAVQQIKLRIDCRDLDIDETRENIEWLSGLAINESWEEYETEAHQAKDRALIQLRIHLEECEKRAAEQAELAELRRKQAEQEQKDRDAEIARKAAEKAKADAEVMAQAERDAAAKAAVDAKAAADKRELELKLQAEKAERERLEAIQKAVQDRKDAEERQKQAVEAERQRQADEAARIEAEARAREADRAHKSKVLCAAKEAIMKAGITEDQARDVVKLIAAGKVPKVSITY